MTTAARDIPDPTTEEALATLDDDADASQSADQSELGNSPDNGDKSDETVIVFPSTTRPVEETTTQGTEVELTERTLVAEITTKTNLVDDEKTERNKVEVTTVVREPEELRISTLSDILAGNFLDDITTGEVFDDSFESTTRDGGDDFIDEGGVTAVTEKSSGDVSDATTVSDNDLEPVITTTELANSDDALDTSTVFHIGNDDDDVHDELTSTQPPSVITQKYQIVFSPTTESSGELTTNGVADDVITTIEPSTTEESTCPGSLECGNVCLTRDKLCDGLQHCEDGEDEQGCDEKMCTDEEFRCASGRCVPGDWKCDGRPDCETGEDEVACAASCPPGQFLCGESRCIEAVLVCDGTRDCGQGEDEDPGVCSCGEDELRCETGGGCVEAAARCDGRLQCPDRSDEWNCVDLNGTMSVRLVKLK